MSPSQSQRLSNWPPAARLLQHRRHPAGVRGRPTSLWQKAGHATGGCVGGALIYQSILNLKQSCDHEVTQRDNSTTTSSVHVKSYYGGNNSARH
ncbi:hypothetical protein PAHAL_7G086300 [Panicum hallii]|uniref:Uncharacterized protein n=1 Tax=Panicum hallii TaxID=206008 RepID=A0A2S3I5F6_9POAL|nr:hypothetical protein PAHAL_7G086300 [Panicum hallii]